MTKQQKEIPCYHKIMRFLLYVFSFGISILIWSGIVFQLMAVTDHNYEFLFNYINIALTLFATVIIGGLFDESGKGKNVKKLFGIGLLFFATALSFLMFFGLVVIDPSKLPSVSTKVIIYFLDALVGAGFVAFSFGTFFLLRMLYDKYLEL